MLEFNEETHEYKLNGVVIPSVTQIISEAGLSSYDNYKFPISLDAAAQNGKNIHRITELADNDLIDYDLLSNTEKDYLDFWNMFKSDWKVEILENELQLVHPVLKYAGTIDRVVMVNGIKTILDIKTGAKVREHGLQLAGYQLLYNAGVNKKLQAKGRMIVYLKSTGYKIEQLTNKTDENIFLSALNITSWKRSN